MGAVASSIDDEASPSGPQPWCDDAAAVAVGLGTDVDRELTEVQAAERLERVGPHQLEAAEPVPAWRKLAKQFRTSDTPGRNGAAEWSCLR
jgi:Cation transporter/ATPase, N-terminus